MVQTMIEYERFQPCMLWFLFLIYMFISVWYIPHIKHIVCLTYILVVVRAIKPTCNFYQLLKQFKLVYQRMLQNESLAVW